MNDVIVIKRECQRCPAVDEIPITAEDIKKGSAGAPPPANKPPKYEMKIDGKVAFSYSHLCPACDHVITKAIDDMGKKREKKTSRRNHD